MVSRRRLTRWSWLGPVPKQPSTSIDQRWRILSFIQGRKIPICQGLTAINHKICFLNFSFSSRSWQLFFILLFLLSKMENLFLNFSFSSRNWRNDFRIFFLFSKLRKNLDFPQNFLTKFSFSSRNLKNYIKFLFLFSKLEK